MSAREVLSDLQSRGVEVWVEAGAVKMAPASLITAEDREAVRAVKPEIVRILTAPVHGSINYPMGVHARRLERCPWDGCAGEVVGQRANNLYLCLKCGWFFELLPPEGLNAIN